jgi:hypothetical protein
MLFYCVSKSPVLIFVAIHIYRRVVCGALAFFTCNAPIYFQRVTNKIAQLHSLRLAGQTQVKCKKSI